MWMFQNYLIAKAMNGFNRYPVRIRSNNSAQSLAHCFCSACGKGQTQNVVWSHLSFCKNVCHPHCEGLSFPGSGSRNHHHRTLNRIHCFFLFWIEPLVFFSEFRSQFWLSLGLFALWGWGSGLGHLWG